MRFHELIWDFDGTLFDTYPAMSRAFRLALEQFGHHRTEGEIYQALKISLQHAIDHYAFQYTIDPDSLLAKYRTVKNPIEYSLAVPFPGALTICSRVVHSGGRNFILTHKERTITDTLLERHRMLHLFTGLIGADDGFPRKPSPEAFIHLIDRYRLNCRQTLAIGDRALDIQAARLAGLPTCLVGNPESRDWGADFHLAALSQLEHLLFSNPTQSNTSSRNRPSR